MRRDDRPQRPEDDFAAWLDGLVLGQEPTGGLAGDSDSRLGELKATALYAHHTARQSMLGDAERQHLKEEIMAATHQPTARLTIGGQRDDQRDSRPARARLLRPLPRVRLSPLVSGAMVALLLIAIVAGYGGMQRAFGPGNGAGQPASVPASAAMSAVTVPNPQNCHTRALSDAELQKIYMAPWEDRTNALPKLTERKAVDAVDGGQILQVYEQMRDCAWAWTTNQQDAVNSLLSPHAIQEMYWRGTAMGGIFDTRAIDSETSAATPPMFPVGETGPSGTPVGNSGLVWQPNFSKTDTYFAQIHVDSIEVMRDGRVFAPVDWVNMEGKGPNPGPPLTALVFIKIDGQWKLDDWIFGTQILTDAGR